MDDRRFWIAVLVLLLTVLGLYFVAVMLLLIGRYMEAGLVALVLWIVMSALLSELPAWVREGSDDEWD